MSFKDKTAIVTGAAQGIGYEISKSLLEQGCNVIINDIDPAAGKEALKKLHTFKEKVSFILGDSGELKLIKKLISTALETYNGLDFVIANAGITTVGSFLDYEEENFQKMLRVNINGTFFICQQAAKSFIDRNAKGKIIVISSTTGLRPHDDFEAYGMTKAAIAYLAKALGSQLAPKNIRVNSITPGATATERTISVRGYEEGWAKLIPTGRTSKTQDIAATALFLLSDSADQITGQNIIVDGGWSNKGLMPEAI